MSVRVENGWVVAECSAADQARVEMSVAGADAEAFVPAFRDYDGKKRTAKVRVPASGGRLDVYMRVDGHVQLVGRVIA